MARVISAWYKETMASGHRDKKGGARAGVADLTIEILTNIRDDIRSIRNEIAGTNDRLDRTNDRLDCTNDRLEAVRVELKAEIATTNQGLQDLGKFMRQIARDQAKHERFHLQHVGLIEKDLEELRERVRKLEENRAQ
ncbi:MAG: hypothetical protein V2A73_02625 [Pseudomonadota bacterium]